MLAPRTLIALLSLLIPAGRMAAAEPYKPIETLPIEESWRWTELEALSPYTVRQVDEAPDGSLWFAIHGGAVHFDGYEATPFLFENDGLEPSNSVAIKRAKDGVVYVLTNRFCARLVNGVWDEIGPYRRHSNSGSAIAESIDGSLWFATMNGLYRFTGDVMTEVENERNSYTSEHRSAKSVVIDSHNRLWVHDGPEREIRRYELDAKSGAITGVAHRFPTNPNKKEPTVELHEDSSGAMWILVGSETQAIQRIENDQSETLLQNWDQFGPAIRSLAETDNGAIWIAASNRIARLRSDGSWEARHLDRFANWFTFLHAYKGETLITGGFTDKVYALDVSETRWKTYPGLNFGCQENDGTTWFISKDKRVVRHEPKDNEWISLGPEDGLIDQPNAMLLSKNGWIWVSGSHGRIAAVAWWDGYQWQHDTHPKFGASTGHASPLADSSGDVYFGFNANGDSPGGSGGIIKYYIRENSASFEYIVPPTVQRHTYTLAHTKNGDLWIGGKSLGVKRGDQPLEVIEAYHSLIVDNITVDHQDAVWIGDWRAGVSRFDGANWKRFSLSEGRTRDPLVSLMADRTGKGIWASTTNSLNRFDGNSWSVHTKFSDLPLMREGGNLRQSPDGSLWINSASRSWNFNMEPAPNESEIRFQTVRYKADHSPPNTEINRYEAKVPESGSAYFEWSGKDQWSRTWKDDLMFSHRIDGEEWSPFKNTFQVSIPSIRPGTHTLEVRARDTDWNIDPTPAMVEFTVVPVLWKRPWFLAVVVLALFAIATLGYLAERNRVRHLIAIEEFKLDFFTNISHELRTPLAVILGPLESLLKSPPSRWTRDKLEMVYRNSQKLSGLVNQLLEFRKVELGKIKYEPVRSDIVLFIKDAIYSHALLWERKKQSLSIDCSEERFTCCFDPSKLQHIVSNLISNAIKYTPEGGAIDVAIQIERRASSDWHSARESNRFSESEARLALKVSDTGIGISAKRQGLIFQPFYRAPDAGRTHEGSGIGLAYTSELVRLWGGEIGVESPIPDRHSNVGTRFTIRLPLIEDANAKVLEREDESSSIAEALDSAHAEESEKSRDAKPSLLLVDDNSDVRLYLESELAEEFKFHTAENGEKGLESAQRIMPDLVITDIMMPGMDGFELCERLKSDPETSHIPVLMLTARSADTHRIKGIETGADDYFVKPVKLDMLRARIEALLESRRKLRERFTRQIVVQPEEIAVTSADEELLTKAIRVVEENMQDEEFDVEGFAETMGMSRSSLYRKLQAIVGQTPFKFIRSIRLKRAAQLLGSGSVNVSETVALVGISGMSHFGKIFRDEFGISPSEYRKRHTAEAETILKE